jgi:hypothetical protein
MPGCSVSKVTLAEAVADAGSTLGLEVCGVTGMRSTKLMKCPTLNVLLLPYVDVQC